MVSYSHPLSHLMEERGWEESEELLDGYSAGQFLFQVIFFFQTAHQVQNAIWGWSGDFSC